MRISKWTVFFTASAVSAVVVSALTSRLDRIRGHRGVDSEPTVPDSSEEEQEARTEPDGSPDPVPSLEETLLSQAVEEGLTLDELETVYIKQVLERMGGNQSRTAKILGIARSTLHRKMRGYGILDETGEN